MYIQLNTYLRHLVVVSLLCCSSIALAVDGVIEINQACAVNTGCFPGDAQGFPVTITQPGSYRLTGNLNLSTQGVNVSGIVVSAPAVTVDLGGFQIVGPTTCSGSGADISCNPTSAGSNSLGVSFATLATAGVVQNGIIRNMANTGISSSATGVRIQYISTLHNGRHGISGAFSLLVINSVAIENGIDGVRLNSGSVIDGVTTHGNGGNGITGRGIGGVVTRTSARKNGLSGFNLGSQYKFGKNNNSNNNELADSCGGGICTERTRFYITKETHQGDSALSACAEGFHMASITELDGLASYVYDYILGATFKDSGSGVPTGFRAWVRTGLGSNGLFNCSAWKTASNTFDGTILFRETISNNIPSQPHLYGNYTTSCNATASVWCIEGEGAE